MTDAKLKSLAERIERLMDERDGIQSDIRDIYAEAKSAGYVPKVLRKAITRKRMDSSKRDEEDAILELYEGALDAKTRAVRAEIAKGTTFDAVTQKTGVPRRTVARIAETVPENKKVGTGTTETADRKPPGDSSERDGEGSSSGAAVASNAAPQAIGAHSTAPQPAPEGGVGTGTHSMEIDRASIAKWRATHGLDDPGPIPPHLDRRKVAA